MLKHLFHRGGSCQKDHLRWCAHIEKSGLLGWWPTPIKGTLAAQRLDAIALSIVECLARTRPGGRYSTVPRRPLSPSEDSARKSLYCSRDSPRWLVHMLRPGSGTEETVTH